MQTGATRDPLEDAIAQADAILAAPAGPPAVDPFEEAIRQADAVLQEPSPQPPATSAPPPLSPLEREVMGNNPATRIGQPLPDFVPSKPPAPPLEPANVPLGPLGEIANEGISQVGRGVVGLGKAAIGPTGPPLPGAASTVNPKTGAISRPSAINPATLAAGSDVVEGTFKALTPLVAAAGLANPAATAWALAKTAAGQQLASKAAQLSGAAPETQRFVGNAGAVVAGLPSGLKLADLIAEAKTLARPLALAAKLSGSGYGPGDVPGARGVPFADSASPRASESAPSERALALEEEIRQTGLTAEAQSRETATPQPATEPPAPSSQVSPEPVSPRAPVESPTAPAEPAAALDMAIRQADTVLEGSSDAETAPPISSKAPSVSTPAPRDAQGPSAIGVESPAPMVAPERGDDVAPDPLDVAIRQADAVLQETPDAVQEQTPTAVDVRQPQTDGGAVGARHAEPSVATGASAVPQEGAGPGAAPEAVTPSLAPGTRITFKEGGQQRDGVVKQLVDVGRPGGTGRWRPRQRVEVIFTDPATGRQMATHRDLDQVTPRADPLEDAIRQADAVLEPSPARKFTSTQVELPPDVGAKLKVLGDQIPPEHLAEDGTEAQPHITVKYGLHDNDPEAVRQLLADEPPITLTLGKTSIFPAGAEGKADVVKVDVDSPDLHRLNAKIAEAFPHTDTHPDYQPHATIAYVKPGLGEQYAGNDALAGQAVTIDRITLSGQDGTLTEISLTGATRGATMEIGHGSTDDAGAATRDLTGRGVPERADAPSGGVQPPAERTTGRGARPPSDAERRADFRRQQKRRQAERVASERQAEADALEWLIEQAQEGGHTADPEPLHRELSDRLQLLRDLDAEFETESGHSPTALLQAIADYGGLSLSAETGLQGELRWLKEHSAETLTGNGAKFGRVGSVTGVFTKRGLSVDDMVTSLRQDAKFEHLHTLNDFLAALRAAITDATSGDAEPLIDRFVRGLGERWWERLGTATPSADDAELTDERGDATFDPREFEGDVNEHGEVQPRLPEAGAVREQDVKTPEFEAPFSLSGGADTTPKERPRSLFAKASPPVAGKRRGPSTGVEVPALPPRGGSTVDAALVPGGRQFVERDVVPALQHAFAELLAVKDDARALLAPDTISDAANVAANVVRVHKALEAQELQRAARLLDNLRKQWDRVSQAAKLAFAMAVDEGDVSGLPAWQRDAAKLFAEINDLFRQAVKDRGGFEHGFIEHYFPRLWTQPGKLRRLLSGGLSVKRPFKGRQAFRKARAVKDNGERFSFRELYELGYRPVHENPVEAWLFKWDEMRKWISAYDILREHKAVGVTKYIPVDTAHPKGWLRYPESYGTVYGKAAVTIEEAFDPKVRSGLEQLIKDLDVRHRRPVNVGHGDAWGYARGDKQIVSKFGGPEGVIMHELGHILDHRYGLWNRIVNPAPREPYTAKKGKKAGVPVWRAVKQDKATVKVRTTIKKELRALADLRYEGQTPDPGYTAYVRNEQEKMANLVHAFLYAPQRAKEVAPHSYWALFNVIKAHAELQPLHDIQKDRGLRLASDSREVTIPGQLITGHYYGPPEAVRIMERYLSPGLSGSRAYRTLRVLGGAMTQVQLGFSAFHLVATGLESIISKTAVGAERVSRGAVLPGLKDLAVSPAAPFINLWKGDQALKALRTQAPSTQRFANIASQIIQGGGREGWDPFWHNHTAVAKWAQAWRNVVAEAGAGNYPGAAVRTGVGLLRTFPMLIEAQAKLVMEFWVPRMKMAAFLDLARLELDDLGEQPDLVEGRKALAKAWDSVDNRFGELVYDNLFWDRRLKDFLLAMMRAPGWSLGTWRELFGAIPAQAGHLAKLSGAAGGGKIPMRLRDVGPDEEGQPRYEAGREPWLTHKFAYFLSALFWIAVFGAVTQYLHTGKKPGEQDDGAIDESQIPLDLYFPRREREEGAWKRIVLPTQLRDVWAAAHNFPYGLGTMASHKLNPLVTALSEFLKNEDYWGTEIHSEEDTIPDQVKDVLTQLAKELRPISVQSIEQSGHKAESILGFTPAPSYVTRTPMENYLRDIAPPTHRTKAQGEAAAARRALRTEARADRAGAKETARSDVQSGALTTKQAVGALKTANTPGIVFSFQNLDLPRALHAYELADPEERRTLQPYLRRKLANAQVAPAERQALTDRAKRALALPIAGAAKASLPVAAR